MPSTIIQFHFYLNTMILIYIFQFITYNFDECTCVKLIFKQNFCCCPSVKHFLKFFYTGTSGLSNFPEFVGSGVLDRIPVGYCNTNIKIVESKEGQVKSVLERNPQQLEWYTWERIENQRNFFNAEIYHLKQHLQQSGGRLMLVFTPPCSPRPCFQASVIFLILAFSQAGNKQFQYFLPLYHKPHSLSKVSVLLNCIRSLEDWMVENY